MLGRAAALALSSERRLKKRLAMPLILAVLSVVSVPVSARTKIGLLDVDRILRDSPTAQRAQARLREEFANRTQELAKLAARREGMQVQLADKSLTAPASERQTRERDLSDATLTLQREQRAFDEAFSKRRDELLAGFYDRMARAVRQVAEAERFDIIFREVAWGSPRIDITEKVIKFIEEDRPASPSSR